MPGNDLFSSGNNLLLPALKMQWTVSDKPVSGFTASAPPGAPEDLSGHIQGSSGKGALPRAPGLPARPPGSGASDANLQELWQQHCPVPSLGREVPFPELPGHLWRRCCRNVPELQAGAAHRARSHPCCSNPGAAPARGDRAASLPKGCLEINCGDGDQSRERCWERAFIEFLIAKSISTSPVAGACKHHTGSPTECPYLLHTAHCILPIHCVSRCTRNPAAFLARFCFQQYSLQGWCIHNEFHNSGHGITAPGSAGKERLLQHTALGEPMGCEIALLEMLAQEKKNPEI